MSKIIRTTSNDGRPFTAPLESFGKPSSQVYFRLDAETGRKNWFFTAEQQIFGPYACFAEADEELSERRAARRMVPDFGAN